MANEGYGNFENAALPDAGQPPAGKRTPESQPGSKPKDDGQDQPNGASAPLPAAGPHADPALINHDATPGAGAMPEGPAPGNDPDPGTG